MTTETNKCSERCIRKNVSTLNEPKRKNQEFCTENNNNHHNCRNGTSFIKSNTSPYPFFCVCHWTKCNGNAITNCNQLFWCATTTEYITLTICYNSQITENDDEEEEANKRLTKRTDSRERNVMNLYAYKLRVLFVVDFFSLFLYYI